MIEGKELQLRSDQPVKSADQGIASAMRALLDPELKGESYRWRTVVVACVLMMVYSAIRCLSRSKSGCANAESVLSRRRGIGGRIVEGQRGIIGGRKVQRLSVEHSKDMFFIGAECDKDIIMERKPQGYYTTEQFHHTGINTGLLGNVNRPHNFNDPQLVPSVLLC
jgi:hypothetical protein